ncbi:LAMI_0E01464g1_1 [Lachancea mirantina]|uniref:Acireductone dioxygenase n=1 Tax=Lachancea mirantina TaxID=1230905 RepID=A0A1G4JIL7_9SACH|nr:LAMI_0E01464g1_1 [Lachancea mirantina]
MATVYYHDEKDSVDSREPHSTGVPVSLEQLADIGVFYKHIPQFEDVNKLATQRNYRNRDTVSISEKALGAEALESKLKMFYAEHLHEDEEIRYCLDGDGFFDLRDPRDERWIRVLLQPGDLLIVPAGIYHRFTLTTRNYIKALRLFKDEPKWVAHGRPYADSSAIRTEYLASVQTQ